MVIEHSEKINEHRRRMQSELLRSRTDRKVVKKTVKSVPKIVQSAKLTKIDLGKVDKKKGR